MARPVSLHVIPAIAFGLLVAVAGLASSPQAVPELRGSYLGQTPPASAGPPAPGATPELFQPDLVSRFRMTRSPVFASGGREMFWSTSLGNGRGQLMVARLGPVGWGDAEALPFSTGEFFDHNPAPWADGRRLVFASNRPIPGKPATTLPGTQVPTSDLWMAERTSTGWSAPVPLGSGINTDADDDVPVVTADGTLYFGSARAGAPGPAAIYRSAWSGRGYGKPEVLPAPVTTSAGEMLNGVAPDQSYVIYLSFARSEAGGLHVAFRTADGGWAEPVKLGEVLTSLRPYFVTPSPDGRVLFFTAAPTGGPPQIYWVDASVVTRLIR